MYQQEIFYLLDRSCGWGHACNQIQNAAFHTLPLSEWNGVALRQEKDIQDCEGSDYLIMNGQYFDWKEFEIKEVAIIMAYLSYFTDLQLKKILNYLRMEKFNEPLLNDKHN